MALSLIDARTSRQHRVLLLRLFPLYAHSLSHFTPFFTIDDRGRWKPGLAGKWLSDPHIEPLLIFDGDEPAGFAIVGRKPFEHMSPDRDFKVCEFFILASFRRRGIGKAAAYDIFEQRRGTWELTILPLNESAQSFWRSILTPYSRGRLEEFHIPGDIVMRFSSV